tara:strand:+ start:48 stop:155 length:108 start_codon:yes stop_codon:yes gene_type:complete
MASGDPVLSKDGADKRGSEQEQDGGHAWLHRALCD